MLSSYHPSILFIVTLVAWFLCNFFRSHYCKNVGSTLGVILMYSAITGILSGVVLLFFGGFTLDISTFTLITAIAFGIVTTITNIFHLLALSTGPLSLTTVVLSFSMVVTALSGSIFWNEELTTLKIIGIILMFLCFILTVKKDENETAVSVKWFGYAILCAVANSGIGLLQKTHQSSQYKHELMPFLVISFILSSIISFVVYLFIKKPQVKVSASIDKKRLIVLAIILLVSGLSIALNNVLCLHLNGIIDSAIFFPVFNGSGIILSVLADVLWFKEKIPGRCWVGIALGSAATLCLCM